MRRKHRRIPLWFLWAAVCGLFIEWAWMLLCLLSGWGRRRKGRIEYPERLDRAMLLGPWGRP